MSISWAGKDDRQRRAVAADRESDSLVKTVNKVPLACLLCDCLAAEISSQ